MVQPGEELPFLTDEVDPRVRHGERVRDAPREGVQFGVHPFAQAQFTQPDDARGRLPVHGREQQVSGRFVVRHGGSPDSEDEELTVKELSLNVHRRWRTRAASAPVPELFRRASHRTTGTSGPSPTASRTSSGP